MKNTVCLTLFLAAVSGAADRATYTYDAAGRLAKADYGNGSVIAYSYDKAGNLLGRAVSGGATAPVVTAAGVVNAASFKGGPIAPGEMITVFGSGIGPATLATFQVASGIVSSNVAGTRFLFDGAPAPILYVSASQSTVMAPYSLDGKTSAQFQVEYLGVRSAPVTVPVAAAAPGLFTANQTGSGPAAVVNGDGSINTASSPAAKGSIILIFLTGDGQTNPAGVDGQLALATFPRTAAPVSVTIGGVDAPVAYSGVAPQSVAGFTQLNVTVPLGAPSGAAVPVVVKVGPGESQPDVTIAVK